MTTLNELEEAEQNRKEAIRLYAEAETDRAAHQQLSDSAAALGLDPKKVLRAFDEIRGIKDAAARSAAKQIDIVTAAPSYDNYGAVVRLTMVVDGQTQNYTISRSAAASAIARIADALSKTP